MMMTSPLATPAVAGDGMDARIPRTDNRRPNLVLRTAATDPRAQYYLHVPRTPRPGAGALVAVHGISRNSHHHARALVAMAERQGVYLVAPHFDRETFPDYQRLGRRGCRADRALEAMLADLPATVRTAPMSMLGFSGGGQFVHRYLMAKPERVARAVVVASGWYTLPDPASRFPRGIAPSERLPGVWFRPRRFLRVPVCVLVGANDNARDEHLRTGRWVDRAQGLTRVDRGRRWVDAMRDAARRLHLSTEYRFQLLAATGHSFSEAVAHGGLIDKAEQFFFGTEEGE